MVTKATRVFAATTIALAVGAFALPAATAAAATPSPATPTAGTPSGTDVGSAAICLNIPIPPFSISFCI